MKTYFFIVTISAILGAAAAKLYFPTEVTKSVEIEVVRNNIVTEVREVVRTDGTKEIVTVIKDNSTKKSTDTATVVAAPKPKWHASLSATRSTDNLFSSQQIYGAQLEYNILGPFSFGVRADTNKQVGLVIGVAF